MRVTNHNKYAEVTSQVKRNKNIFFLYLCVYGLIKISNNVFNITFMHVLFGNLLHLYTSNTSNFIYLFML